MCCQENLSKIDSNILKLYVLFQVAFEILKSDKIFLSTTIIGINAGFLLEKTLRGGGGGGGGQ